MKFRVSVIFLAGGQGTRMHSQIPKQFLPLGEKPVVFHSLERLMAQPNVAEIIVVCENNYKPLFEPFSKKISLRFALPGPRRQDSVFNGLQAVEVKDLVCVHDSARPFPPDLTPLFEAAHLKEAAVLGIPVRFTVKEADEQRLVIKTLKRECLYEIQTPQVARYELLQKGFERALSGNFTVTDDVSLIELIGKPVQIVPGREENFKITSYQDFEYAEYLLTKI